MKTKNVKRKFQRIAMSALLLLILAGISTACGASSAGNQNALATATALGPTEMPPALAFAIAVEQVKATSAAIEATQIWIYGQLTATQAVKEEVATKQAAAITQQAFVVGATATAQVFNAQSTATQQAFVANQAATDRSYYATATSQVQGTATAYPMTATAQSNYATQTEQAWQTTATMDAAYGAAQATAAYGDSESVNLSIERERVTNMTRAWVPWMGFIATLAFIIVVGIKWSKTRVIQRDAFGALPGVIIDGLLRDPDREAGADRETTARAQYVQAVRALPGGRAELPILPFMNNETKPLAIEVIQPGQLIPWIEDVSRQADDEEN